MLLWNDALVFQLGGQWLAQRLGSAPYDTQTSDIDVELVRLSSTVPQNTGRVSPGNTARCSRQTL
jgi:hypothetical protein